MNRPLLDANSSPIQELIRQLQDRRQMAERQAAIRKDGEVAARFALRALAYEEIIELAEEMARAEHLIIEAQGNDALALEEIEGS